MGETETRRPGGRRFGAMIAALACVLACALAVAPTRALASAQTVVPHTETTGQSVAGNDVIKGWFSYPSSTSNDEDTVACFYYSDGYFSDSETYSDHLSSMSMALAMAAMGKNADGSASTEEAADPANETYRNKFAHVTQLLSDIGCADDSIHVSESYLEKPTEDGVGVAIASKTIELGGQERVLVPVAVRGANYEREWANSVTVGETGEAAGFASAADQVLAEVKAYLADHGLEDAAAQGRVCFWVTGYSRAGAVANLAAKRLVDAYGSSGSMAAGNEVFAYCFEAPQGGAASENDTSAYSCIHNVVNACDIVPLVVPSQMGLCRYGVDHVIAGTSASSEQKEAMLAQLAACGPQISYDDTFSLATLDYTGVMSGGSLVQACETEESVSCETWLANFVAHAQEWGLGGDAESWRSAYVTGSTNSYGSPQEALSSLLVVLYGHSASERQAIVAGLSKGAGQISKFELFLAIAGWGNLTDVSSKDSYLDKWWGTLSPCISDKLTAEELEQVRGAYKPLADLLLRVVSKDAATKQYGATYKGGLASQVDVGTLAYNASRILANHDHEVNLAWLRAADSFYDAESSAYVYDASAPSTPRPSLEPDAYKGDQTVALSSQAGAAVYWRMSADGGAWSEWALLEGGSITLPSSEGATHRYRIETYAEAYDLKSGLAELIYTIEEKPATYTLAFETNGGTELPVLTLEEGTEVDPSQYVTSRAGYTFSGWYTDGALTAKAGVFALTGDTTLYAKWVQNAVPSSGGGSDAGGSGSNAGADVAVAAGASAGAGASSGSRAALPGTGDSSAPLAVVLFGAASMFAGLLSLKRRSS